jgi:hypothetical protein
LIRFFINQFILACFNLLNAKIDAGKIFKNIHIVHGLNGAAYISFTCILYYLSNKPELNWHLFPYIDFILFLFSSFFQRQITFDIPLNLDRGLDWDYVTPEKPPKAIMDRIEIRVFGYNGRAPIFIYSLCWLSISIIYICTQLYS